VDLITQGAALLFTWVVVLLACRFRPTLTTWFWPSVAYLALGLLSLLFVGQVWSRLVRGGGATRRNLDFARNAQVILLLVSHVTAVGCS